MGHTLRLLCVDKRYSHSTVVAFLQEQLGESYEYKTAGVSLMLSERHDFFRRQLAAQIPFLVGAGLRFEEVQIIDHYDAQQRGHGCKAYGEDDSHARHERNAREAFSFLQAIPELQEAKIRLFLHDIDANILEELPSAVSESASATSVEKQTA